MAEQRYQLETDADAERALTTYRHYLMALRVFVSRSYHGGELRRLSLAQRNLTGFSRLGPSPSYDSNRVRELLFNAWHTEIVLRLPLAFRDPGLVRFTNQWAPVQAYYAVYSLWRAWLHLDATAADSHRRALRSVSAIVRERSLFPPPWSYAVAGGHLLRDAEHVAFTREVIHDVNPLTRPVALAPDEDWISKVLRTTRRFFLDDEEAKWKRMNRTRSGQPYRRIPPAQRQQIRLRLHPTTLFDFFYRLRVRSNYRDVDDFVSGHLDDADAADYFRSLLLFTRSTMFLVESVVRARMRQGAFDRNAERFLESAERAAHSGLEERASAWNRVET